MKFDINNYKGNYVMHVTTESQAKIFCKYLHEQGKKWTGDDSYLEETNFDEYRELTVYDFNYDLYNTLDHVNDYKDTTILEFTDFEWDEEYDTAPFTVLRTVEKIFH